MLLDQSVTVSLEKDVDIDVPKLITNYNQNIDSLARLFSKMNEIHDDYIRYFLYNNVNAGSRLRKKLNEIIEEMREIRREINITKTERLEQPFKHVKKQKPYIHVSEWD